MIIPRASLSALLVLAGLAAAPAFAQNGDAEIKGPAPFSSSDAQFAEALSKGDAEIKKPSQPAAEDTEEKRFEKSAVRLVIETSKKAAVDRDAALEYLAKGLHDLIKEYPRYSENIYKMILSAAGDASDLNKQRSLAADVAANAPTADLKTEAAEFIDRIDTMQRPLQIQFAAANGAAVDVSSMTGKVVLIDFWATWCRPCLAGLPDLLGAYSKFNPHGLEIVGISLDWDRKNLDDMISRFGIAWPQYFDGRGWRNKYAVQYGIDSIPQLWLVDKKGRLRYTDARAGLVGKIQKLLAE